MKVLIVGATGNVGSRLVQALVAHNCQVVAFVRSESKLQSLIDEKILSKVTVVTGDATDSTTIQQAYVQNSCDALAMTAGLAAIFPWQAPRMPEVVNPVIEGAVRASKELGQPVRCWFMGGMALLDVPGTKTHIRRYIPLFVEHYLTLDRLSACSSENLIWSILCPSTMVPADPPSPVKLTGRAPGNVLTGSVDSPPAWDASWVTRIPVIGPFLDIAMHAANYITTLEDCADFIAEDLQRGAQSPYAGHRVGVIDDGKLKTS